MKIAILHGPRDLRIEQQALDTSNLAPDAIWVKTQISAFKIGTDRGNYEGAETVPGAPEYPRWVGDSNLGVVRGVGADVTAFKAGDLVLSTMHHQSEYVESIAPHMTQVSPDIDPENAVFANLYNLSAHCYHKALFRPCETVAVVGLGTLGLGAVAVGPFFGARVAAIGNDEVRLNMAVRMGAHTAVASNDPRLAAKLDAFTAGRGIDLVILTANPWPAYRTAVEIVRPNGRVAIVSLLGRGEQSLEFNPLSMDLFYIKGISLIAVSGPDAQLYPSEKDDRGYWRHRDHLLSLMAEGKLTPKDLISHRLPYTRIAEAYDMAFRREKNMMNVVFDWREG